MFSIYYKKQTSKDRELLKFLGDSTIELENAQYYSPIFKGFFSLNNNNYNSITLNHKYHLTSIHETEKTNLFEFNDDGDLTLLNGTNSFSCDVTDASGNVKKTETFFKFSPLLDPVKYAIGKYIKEGKEENKKYNDESLFLLPNLNDKNKDSIVYDKINDGNNSAYVDGMFTYLTSQLLHHHNFIHGLDYYGSFVGIKNHFVSNVVDEVEILFDSSHFEKKLGDEFHIDSIDKEKLIFSDTRNFKNRLKILGEEEKLEVLTIDDKMFEGIFFTFRAGRHAISGQSMDGLVQYQLWKDSDIWTTSKSHWGSKRSTTSRVGKRTEPVTNNFAVSSRHRFRR